MFNTHLSDDEQAEALKRWWSENGKSVIGGIVLGLALVFGWKGWNEHQQNQAEMASAEYDRMLVILQRDDLAAATLQSEKIVKDYASTAYDYFAAMDLSKAMVSKDDLAGARKQLEYAVANADDAGLKLLAQSRLARVLLAMNETAAAQSLISSTSENTFSGEFSHIQGDIHKANGDMAAASAAYQKALQNNAGNRALIEMKLNEVKQETSGES